MVYPAKKERNAELMQDYIDYITEHQRRYGGYTHVAEKYGLSVQTAKEIVDRKLSTEDVENILADT